MATFGASVEAVQALAGPFSELQRLTAAKEAELGTTLRCKVSDEPLRGRQVAIAIYAERENRDPP